MVSTISGFIVQVSPTPIISLDDRTVSSLNTIEEAWAACINNPEPRKNRAKMEKWIKLFIICLKNYSFKIELGFNPQNRLFFHT